MKMNFKYFLQEAIANPEKAKAELDKIGKDLVDWFKDNFGSNLHLIKDNGYTVNEYGNGKIVILELEVRLLNQGYTEPVMQRHKNSPGRYSTGRNSVHNTADLDEINSVLKKAMDDAKKVIKSNGLKQNKDYMSPASSAKAKAKGTKVEINFWIGFDKA